MNKHKNLHQNQQGLVSIIIVMTLMGILVLVSTSFALLMRREQRQSLDRQLSTQAFYAAESGVHDTAARIEGITSDITDCDDTRIKNGNQRLDSTGSVEYTCVLVDPTPRELIYDPINTDSSTVVRLQTVSGPISRIDISWQDASEGGVGTSFATNNNHYLPTKDFVGSFNSSTGTGIVRATVMPIRNPLNITRDQLIADARTYFLYPKGDTTNTPNRFGSVDALANNAQFIDGQCNTASRPYYCNTRITNLTTTNNGVVYLRLKSVYRSSAVHIRIYNASGVQTDVLGAQAVIDSTGRASDVLRRILVRIPLKGSYLFPEHAIESIDTICKRTAYPGSGQTPIVDMPAQATSLPADWAAIDYNRPVDNTVCSPTAP